MDAETQTAAPAQDLVQIDNRKFRFVSQELTAAQDDWIVGHLRRCGAIEALANDEASIEQRAEDLLTRVMLAGETFAVLAGLLVEEGKRWTRAEAERNTQRFAAITDAKEKAEMRSSLVSVVLGFFDYARRSSATSPKSSSPSAKAPSIKNADPATSETSLPSFETSAEATQAASTR